MVIGKRLPETKEGLPGEAFAIADDPEDPDTWKLPHHRKSIFRVLRGKQDIEKTVDWKQMEEAVRALSLDGSRRRRVAANPEQILESAVHLAGHYRKANKPLPDVLAALV